MKDRYELFLYLVQTAFTMRCTNYRDAVRWLAELQDSNLRYNIQSGVDETVETKVFAYLDWRLEAHRKPFWYVLANDTSGMRKAEEAHAAEVHKPSSNDPVVAKVETAAVPPVHEVKPPVKK